MMSYHCKVIMNISQMEVTKHARQQQNYRKDNMLLQKGRILTTAIIKINFKISLKRHIQIYELPMS